MSKAIPIVPEWLRAPSIGPVGVDREAKVIRGMVVAQAGPFKSQGRGEFDDVSLQQIVALMQKEPVGLKSRFAHPTLSDDGLGRFLGRVSNPRLDKVAVRRGDQVVTLSAVRGDLHLDPTSFETPNGNLGKYVLDLAESDPDAFSSSLVLKADQELRLDAKSKKPLTDASGKSLPPLWRPKELHASDVVDRGDAVDGILSAELSAENLPDEIVRLGSGLIDRAFPDASREVIEARLNAWRDKYLAYRFGDESVEEESPPLLSAGPSLAVLRKRIEFLEKG